MTDMEMENLLYQHIQKYKDKIKDLEETVALWRGVHEGAVLAMQAKINALEAALEESLDEWEGHLDYMTPKEKKDNEEMIADHRKLLSRKKGGST